MIATLPNTKIETVARHTPLRRIRSPQRPAHRISPVVEPSRQTDRGQVFQAICDKAFEGLLMAGCTLAALGVVEAAVVYMSGYHLFL